MEKEEKRKKEPEMNPEKIAQALAREAGNGRLFIDMDGTLARYQPVDTLEVLFEKGYFQNLEPQQNVVDAVKRIRTEHPEKQVYIMSSVLSDSSYALEEKNAWLDRYLPEIDQDHRIFPPCGENKLDYVPEGIRASDHLLDDYTKNLTMWEPPAKGIKLLNGINHTQGTWNGHMLRYDKDPGELAADILAAFEKTTPIQDERPLHQKVDLANQAYDQRVKSSYVSEGERSQLEFLTQPQALAALKEGIHICSVNDFPVYHGIHADEYAVTELRKEQGVKNLYSTFGIGVIHKACISPYYDHPAELRRLLEERTRNVEKQKEAAHPAAPATRRMEL